MIFFSNSSLKFVTLCPAPVVSPLPSLGTALDFSAWPTLIMHRSQARSFKPSHIAAASAIKMLFHWLKGTLHPRIKTSLKCTMTQITQCLKRRASPCVATHYIETAQNETQFKKWHQTEKRLLANTWNYFVLKILIGCSIMMIQFSGPYVEDMTMSPDINGCLLATNWHSIMLEYGLNGLSYSSWVSVPLSKHS